MTETVVLGMHGAHYEPDTVDPHQFPNYLILFICGDVCVPETHTETYESDEQ